MEPSILSKRILRELCTNSRVTITELSKKYKLSRKSANERIKALEKELGLKYVLELNYAAAGFTTLRILKVKFKKMPGLEILKNVLSESKIVQFAATTKGHFDMIIFTLAKESREYFKWEVGLCTLLAKYGVNTSSSEVTLVHLGFMPINNELVKESHLKDIYKKIIIELNQNSRMKLRELSRRLGLGEELVKYYIKKLGKEKIILRYTAIVTKPPLRYNFVYFFNYTIKEGLEKRVQNERREMYFKEPDEFPTLNEFQLMFSTTGSDASFTWALYDNYETGLKQSVFTHDRIYRVDSPLSRYAVIENVVKGDMPLRNIDMKENYDITLGGIADV